MLVKNEVLVENAKVLIFVSIMYMSNIIYVYIYIYNIENLVMQGHITYCKLCCDLIIMVKIEVLVENVKVLIYIFNVYVEYYMYIYI